jgi:hypothetical protein
MKTFRGITGSGDWTFGAGRESYFRDSAAIAADIRTALLLFLNDCFFAMTTGIDWWNLLGAKNPVAKENIVIQTRATILSREGVVRVNSVEAAVNPTTRKVTLKYDIDTIYSRNLRGFLQTP